MSTTDEIDLSPEPGWSGLEHLGALNVSRSFVSGDPHGDRLRLRYYRRDADGAMVGKVWFGPGSEGPPGHAHGGSMAAVLDEAMGGSAWMAGHAVVAAEIRIRYLNMLPLGTVTRLEAWVSEVEGRKVSTRSHLVGGDRKVYAAGDGLFMVIDLERFGDKVKQAFARMVPSDLAGEGEG